MKIKMISTNKIKQSLYEMANFSSKDSGLPLDIWIDSMGSDRNTTHNLPRVKIGKSNSMLIPVSIKPTKLLVSSKNNCYKESDIKKTLKFIENNQDVLLKHWNKELTDVDALIKLKNNATLNTKLK